MDISIVIPVYNSENILPKLLEEINNSLNGVIDSFEVILINDRSKDDSWEVIKKLKQKYNFLIGINLRKNAGQHNAIMAGLNYAKGDVVITMDDDLQHDPKYIIKLYNQIKSGYDVCYTKYNNRQHKKWKILGSKFNNLVASILIQKPKELYLSSFKAISKDIKNEMIQYPTPYIYLDGMILSITDNITTIEIEHKERLEGESNYTFFKLLSLWTQMATNFSILPLRIATFLGITISLFSFLLGVYYIILKFLDKTFPEGWTSLIVIVLFFGGIILTSLGIIGEYIGRTYLQLNGKKQYTIKEVINE